MNAIIVDAETRVPNIGQNLAALPLLVGGELRHTLSMYPVQHKLLDESDNKKHQAIA